MFIAHNKFGDVMLPQNCIDKVIYEVNCVYSHFDFFIVDYY